MGRRLLARAGLLAVLTLALVLPVHSQAVTWEAMPGVRELPTDPDPIAAIDFLRGEGAQASDPAADTLVVFMPYGTFLYNPSGAAGAAGSNGPYGPWHRLEPYGARDGLVTAAGTFVKSAGALQPSRATGRGRAWTYNYDARGFDPYIELEHAAPVGALITGTSDDGRTARSLADGVPGSWIQAGTGFGFPESFGEVPPSAALPNGRVLMGVWNGAVYSDDGGLSYIRSNAYGNARYIVHAFAFLPQPGHSYGGVTFVGLHNTALGPGPSAEVHRSDDGGATWTLAHRFTAAELDLPVFQGEDTDVDVHFVTALVATPDGALWAAVGFSGGASNPARGGIAQSLDGGMTWSRADEGFRDETGRGYQTDQLKLSRTGVLYAATERGVWRTTAPVVAGEASPVETSGVAVSVRPNPAGGRVEVVVSLAAAGAVRVVVVDALGREVAVVLDGEAAGERVIGVDTASWPAGVYVVRAEASGRIASARLVVAR